MNKTSKYSWLCHKHFIFVLQTGEEVGIILHKPLPNGNYSVPMVIQDQQNQPNEDSLFVIVCECEEDRVCHKHKPLSTGLGSAAIGLILAGILLFLSKYKIIVSQIDVLI